MSWAENFILLPRSVFLSDAWQQVTGEQVKAYLDLCFRVAYCESEYKCRYGNIKLQKGQMVMSLRNLGKKWKCDFNKVYRILNSLESMGLIKRDKLGERFFEHTEHHVTLLTVKALNDHADDDSERLSEQDNNNNLSSDKSVCVKRAREKAFVIPSVTEIQQYLDGKGVTTFTAEEFYNYYESVGWMVGPNKKMKSWHGAVGTWISNRKQNKNSYDTKTNYHPRDREEEAAQRHQKFVEHVIRKLNGEEKRSDELPFQ